MKSQTQHLRLWTNQTQHLRLLKVKTNQTQHTSVCWRWRRSYTKSSYIETIVTNCECTTEIWTICIPWNLKLLIIRLGFMSFLWFFSFNYFCCYVILLFLASYDFLFIIWSTREMQCSSIIEYYVKCNHHWMKCHILALLFLWSQRSKGNNIPYKVLPKYLTIVQWP